MFRFCDGEEGHPKNTRYAASICCVHLKYALAFSGGKIILSQGEGGGRPIF